MKITGIEKQKHDDKRYSIFIDGEFAFGMSGVDVLQYKLEEGMDISSEKLGFLYDRVLFDKARDKAVHFLSYRQRSKKEIVKKLEESDFPAQVIEKVLELLINYNYVDDYKFAEDYVSEKLRLRGYGKRRLEQELREKGIDRDIVEEVLEEAEIDEVELALVHLERKSRGERNPDENEKRRLFDYLQRRGFSYDIIKEAFKIYREQE